MCQYLYNTAKKIVKKDACMKFYDIARPLYLETTTSGISLGARLLQLRDSMNCDEIKNNAILCQIETCQQKPTECRAVLQQCRMKGSQDTTGDRKVLQPLLREGSMCYQ